MSLKYNGDFASKIICYVLIFECISALKNNGTNYKLIDTEDLKRYAELGDSLMQTFSEKVLNMTKDLESFNDKHIGRSIFAKYYEEWKPRLDNEESTMRSKNKNQGNRPRPRPERDGDGRGVKKLGMAMMPLVFHVGASSTWMVITAIMSFKAVALMTILLVVKIAVASAKVSSFFTHHYGHKEHITWSSPHHGYDHDVIGHRSFPDIYDLERKSSPSPSISSGFQPIYSQPTVEQLDFNPRHGYIPIESKSRSELDDLEEKFSFI